MFLKIVLGQFPFAPHWLWSCERDHPGLCRSYFLYFCQPASNRLPLLCALLSFSRELPNQLAAAISQFM